MNGATRLLDRGTLYVRVTFLAIEG